MSTLTTLKPEELTLTRIAHDVNGNPRYVLHFLQMNTRAELDAVPWIGVSEKYALAVKRANTIGGRKYHNRSYGGGIVFQSYSVDELARHVSRVTGRDFAAVVS
jgi:homogentisate 1,2-dioxygenase